MKIYVSTWPEKKTKLGAWHRWFAWHPIGIWSDGRWTYVWWQTVERRGAYEANDMARSWIWNYRLVSIP